MSIRPGTCRQTHRMPATHPARFAASHGTVPAMSLKFKNRYPTTIWAMIEWYYPNCPDGGDWAKAGWWKIAPGKTKTVYGGDLDDVNRYWYFYAHGADGAQWAGPYPEIVPHHAFDWCKQTAGNPSETVGMRELDINGKSTYTLRFIP